MPPELGILLLPGLVMMGISFSLVVLAFCAYFRLKGIERAAWALVAQLQSLRHEHPSAPVPAGTLAQLPEVPVKRHVYLSMFGR